MKRVYNIFICHAFDNQQIYSQLVVKLNDAKWFEWADQSVPMHTQLRGMSDEELKEVLGKKIEASDVMLVLTLPVATRRKWIQWEIMCAKWHGRPVIGVARRTNDDVSKFVREMADELVLTWRQDHITKAIRCWAKKAHQRAQRAHIPFPPLNNEAPDQALSGIDVARDEGMDEALIRAAEKFQPQSNAPLPKDVIFGGQRDDEPTTGPPPVPPPWRPFRRRH